MNTSNRLLLVSLIFLLKIVEHSYAQEGDADQPTVETTRSTPRLHYLEKPIFVELNNQTDFIEYPDNQSSEKAEIDFTSEVDDGMTEPFERAIEAIEENGGAWDSQLVEQLSSLGSLQQQRLNHPAAIESYKRAIQISRIAQGLHTPDQIPLLESMIDSLIISENWEQADLYSDYLFFVQHKAYGIDDPRLIPAIERLASWNIMAFNLGYGDQLGAD